MSTLWQKVEAHGILEIPNLPGVRVNALPVFKDVREAVLPCLSPSRKY